MNSKNKPHSEEEEKEEEEEEEEKEEEKEVATAMYGNDLSVEHVDMNACDHFKQGIKHRLPQKSIVIQK